MHISEKHKDNELTQFRKTSDILRSFLIHNSYIKKHQMPGLHYFPAFETQIGNWKCQVANLKNYQMWCIQVMLLVFLCLQEPMDFILIFYISRNADLVRYMIQKIKKNNIWRFYFFKIFCMTEFDILKQKSKSLTEKIYGKQSLLASETH